MTAPAPDDQTGPRSAATASWLRTTIADLQGVADALLSKAESSLDDDKLEWLTHWGRIVERLSLLNEALASLEVGVSVMALPASPLVIQIAQCTADLMNAIARANHPRAIAGPVDDLLNAMEHMDCQTSSRLMRLGQNGLT